ncbi:MAG: D-glycero-beta-D-manno-heptose 1,7-bisphosphate 7-phosphatase [Nanoarchaeota archaeon]
MNRAVFLDRDGTINRDSLYAYKIEDFVFLPGVKEGLKKLQALSFKLIVITSQSGIARGFYTEEDLEKVHAYMRSALEKEGVHLDAVYYCPHHPEAGNERYRKVCDCRKPKIGLFLEAKKRFDIDLKKSYMIGDRSKDMAAGKTAGCTTIYLDVPKPDDHELKAAPDYSVKNFPEAVQVILERESSSAF